MKTTKLSLTIIIFLIITFLFIQVAGLVGKQSDGWSLKYITTYLILGGVAVLLIAVFGFLIEYSAKRISDHPILDILSIGDFDDSQDFRLFNGSNNKIAIGLVSFLIFFIVIFGTVAIGLINWQPIPSPLVLDSTEIDPLSQAHQQALDNLGITKGEEAWFTSAQPAFMEDVVFNYFIPLLFIAVLLIPVYLWKNEITEVSFLIASIVGITLSSGIAGAWSSGLIPTFAGAHSDVYSSIPSFWAAAIFSFVASFINVHLGFPISIIAHFANNWFVVMGSLVTLAVGVSAFIIIPKRWIKNE